MLSVECYCGAPHVAASVVRILLVSPRLILETMVPRSIADSGVRPFLPPTHRGCSLEQLQRGQQGDASEVLCKLFDVILDEDKSGNVRYLMNGVSPLLYYRALGASMNACHCTVPYVPATSGWCIILRLRSVVV